MDYEDLILAAAVALVEENNAKRKRRAPKQDVYQEVTENSSPRRVPKTDGHQEIAKNTESVPEIDGHQEIAEMTPSDFKNNFQLTKHQFELLLRDLAPEYTRKYTNYAPLHEKLLTFLWTMCTTESYREISVRFGIAKSSVSNLVPIISGIIKVMAEQYVKWPTDHNKREIIHGFSQKGCPNTIGAIDGTHIHIQLPKNNPKTEVYFNRKKFTSVILLAVCDDKSRFTYISTGYPGSFHDSLVLRRSGLGNTILHEHNPFNDYHIIGDSAFPLCLGLMVPYRDDGHLTSDQQNYNTKLSSGRMCIKRAFGLLKGKFRRLKLLPVQTPENATNIIIACSILHNISLQNEDEYEADEEEAQEIADEIEPYEEENQHLEGRRSQEAVLKRDFICKQIVGNIY